MTHTFAIVGASHAAAAAIDHLRRSGFEGRIVLIGDEPYLPYQRPPLSKKFLLGELPLERLAIRPPAFYEQHRVETHLNTRVTAIDTAQRRIRLDADGSLDDLQYDKLLLCTGSRARTLTCEGHDLRGVHNVRTAQDVVGLQPELIAGKKLAVIGAGYIGLEIAASARKLGLDVTVLEMADRCLNRVTSPIVSDFFARRHALAGVTLRCNVAVNALLGNGRVRALRCGDEEILTDIVIAGIGVVPNMQLAQAAGIECENGIVVDTHCRTSDPHIYAAGDCTVHPSVRYGGRVRLESVDNASEQGRVAAANMCGVTTEHAHVPWFWSEQYDVRLQTAGLLRDHDRQIVRGDAHADDAKFSVWYLRGDEVLAVDAINRPGDFMLGKKWIAERKHIAAEQLADTAADLKSL
jgi:3-phenylpropionate/trans-cinnamate dioxygenase ferredoxin reductase subunit